MSKKSRSFLKHKSMHHEPHGIAVGLPKDRIEVARQFRKAPKPTPRGAVPDLPNVPDALASRKGRPEFVEVPVSESQLKTHHDACNVLKGRGESIESYSIRNFRYGELAVVLTRETGVMHLSVSHPKRLPTWDEMSQIWYVHLAKHGETGVLVLPKPEDFVNIHRFCLQIFEVDPGLLPGD